MKIKFLIISFIALLASCASPVKLPLQYGTLEQKTNALNNIDPNQSLIVLQWSDEPNLIEKTEDIITAGYFTCSLDDQEVANLHGNSFVTITAVPGTHKIECKRRKQDYMKSILTNEEQKGGMVLFGAAKGQVALISLYPTSPIIGVENLSLEDAKLKITKGNYAISSIANLATTYEDPRFKEAKKSQNLTLLRDFLKDNPHSEKAREGKRLEKRWLASQKAYYKKITNAKKPSTFLKYLNKWPGSYNEAEVVTKTLEAIKSSKDPTPLYGQLYAMFPHILSKIPKEAQDKVLIYGIGPKGLTVGELITMRSQGRSSALLTAKISAATSPYKNFSFEESDFLKSQGLDDEVIGAMIAVTTKLGAVAKTKAKTPSVNVGSNAALKEAGEDNSLQGAAKEAATDCAKYIAAKKACSFIPFGSSICLNALSSKFDATTVAVCSKIPI